MSKKGFYSALILILSVVTLASAQTNCERNLLEAQNDYRNGNLYEIPSLLEDCINNGFDRQQKMDAYKLLTLTFLNINQPSAAKRSLTRLMKLNPEFEANPATDPEEFVLLYKKVRQSPQYSFGGQIQGNLSYVLIEKHYSVSSFPNSKGQITPLAGFTAGGHFIYPITYYLSAEAQLNFSKLRFSYSEEFISDPAQVQNNSGLQQIKFVEDQSSIQLPVLLSYLIELKKFDLTIKAGAYEQFLINSNFRNVQRDNLQNISESIKEPKVSMTSNRKRLNTGVQLSVGSLFKVSRYRAGIELGVKGNIFRDDKYASQNARNTDSKVFNNGYIDDQFRTAAFFISLSFSKPVYRYNYKP